MKQVLERAIKKPTYQGRDGNSETGMVLLGLSDPDKNKADATGADHVLALRRDGSVLSWGFGEQGQLGRLGSRMRSPEETMLLPGLVPLHNVQGNRLLPSSSIWTMYLAFQSPHSSRLKEGPEA